MEGMIEEAHFPYIVRKYWYVFRELLVDNYDKRRDFRTLLFKIKSYRNSETHHVDEGDISVITAEGMMKTIAEALRTIKADSSASKVEEDLRKIYDLSRSPNTQRAEQADIESNGRSSAGTKQSRRTPWSAVIQPHQDIIDGLLVPHQFAADLQEVYDGGAEDTVYGNPVMFFRHTYLTEGITTLLKEALRRLAGKGSHPIIQAQTGFGGGKTHSLIALYHMVTNSSTLGNTSEDTEDQENRSRIREILRESGVSFEQELEVAVSVLHGTYLSPTDSRTTETGDPLNTLWGVMAYQLGGQAGYDLIGEAARTGSAPGGQQLQALFQHVGPSLILVDEIVNYARNMDETQVDRLYSFFQTLTDAIPAAENVVMVVALPASEREQGNTRAVEITQRLETILGRVQAVWRPVEDREGFEVIRRRLFQDFTCDDAARDATCEEFARLYKQNNIRNKLPEEAKAEEYVERIRASYPIHPEVFDRIFEDWSTYARFQRTRGALRMMALFIHRLYYSENKDLIIMPGNLPFYDKDVSGEFLNLLGENWNPVVAEVDSEISRVRAIKPPEIAQRIARSIFFGSMPERQSPGLSDRQIHLGALMPGLPVKDVDRALTAMQSQLYYLYRSDGRRYFSSEINVERAVEHRRSTFQNEDDDNEIAKQLRDVCSDDCIIVCPETTDEVPDEPVTRTVILFPECIHMSNRDTAMEEAIEITTSFGDQKRQYPNGLLFNCVHGSRQSNLRSIARRILAWNSLINGNDRIEHLSQNGKQRAEEEISNARQDLHSQLANAYNYMAGPVLTASNQIDIKWEAMRFISGEHRLEDEIPKLINSQDGRWFAKPTDPKIEKSVKQALVDRKPDNHAPIYDVVALLASDLSYPRIAGLAHMREALTHLIDIQAVGYATSYDAESATYVGLVLSSDDLPNNIAMTDLLLDPEAAAIAREISLPIPPWELDGNGSHGSDVSDDPLRLEAQSDGNSVSTGHQVVQTQDDEISPVGDQIDSETPLATTDVTALPIEESTEDIKQEESSDAVHSLQVRYSPKISETHSDIRAFINQAIFDLREAGGTITVKQETTITTISELENIPRRIELNDATNTEVVITITDLVDVAEEGEEIIQDLKERIEKEKSIKFET